MNACRGFRLCIAVCCKSLFCAVCSVDNAVIYSLLMPFCAEIKTKQRPGLRNESKTLLGTKRYSFEIFLHFIIPCWYYNTILYRGQRTSAKIKILPICFPHIITLALQTPKLSFSRTSKLSGNIFSSRWLKLVEPKYASKLLLGSTVQSLSSGLLAMQ